MSVPSIQPTTVLVDWNSQIHAAKPPRSSTMEQKTQRTLEYVGKIIGRVLQRENGNLRFDVTLRIYHGWHKGFEPTSARKAMVRISNAEDVLISNSPNVIIRPTIYFGDQLVIAKIDRLHARLLCHLPNTLRAHSKLEGEVEEKMVDTSIASDLIHLAHSDPERWLVVVGEDDDLVPPVLTAEAIRGAKQGRVLLVRQRQSGPFLKLENLRVDP